MNDRPELQRRLIGRAGERAALARTIDAICAGRPTMVLVEGPAGIGKTALVEEVLLSDGKGLEVLRVTGVPWESDLSFGIAQQLARASSGDGTPDGPLPSGVLETAEHLHHLWVARQRHQPLAVVVDDAHWADTESLRAIRSAVRRMSAERVLVVMAARDEHHMTPEDSSPVALPAVEFLETWRDTVVRPRPLTAEDVRALARESAGITLDLPTARRLCQHTTGNPWHITRLLRELPAETWEDRRLLLPAPARYTSAVRHRLNQCSAPARTLVAVCSVLGQDTSLAQAAALAALDDPLPAVDEAHAAGLLIATTDPGRALLSFTSPLTRAAVLTGLSLTNRAELHRRAAELTEDRGARLMHRVAATTTTDAALADELDSYAAERASAGEWAAVADTLVIAGRLTPERGPWQHRLLRAVDAMIGAGDVPQATAFAPELESFPQSTLRDTVLGYLAIMQGRPAEAETFLTQAQDHCDPQRSPELMAKICQRRVLHALGRWDATDLVTWARRAVELAVSPDDPSAVESQAVLGLGLAAMGHTDEADTAYDGAASRLPGGAQPQRFQLGRGWVDLALDRPEAARRRFEEAVPTSYRMGSTRISLWAQAWLARTQFLLGAWDEALETVERAAARIADVRIELVRPLVHWTAAQIHALRGDWDQAERHVNLATADLHHYEVMLIPACLAKAAFAEAQGDYRRVVDALTPLRRLPCREAVDEPGFWPWQGVYANALVIIGSLDEADAFLTSQEQLAARRGRHSALARLGLARGRLTAARGDIDTARAQFDQALAHLDHLPLPYDRARVDFAYGQTLRRAGKRREADTMLRNARDLYLTLGAHTYVERCDRELKAGGLHAPRTPAGLSHLTNQEQAVACLVASGASNKQTAAELFISEKTVQYHLTHIYAKLRVRTRSELAARFTELVSAERLVGLC